MSATQQMDITLSNEMAAFVRAKVETGEYASESEVICEGLRHLLDMNAEMEEWLHREVVPAYDAHKADPTNCLTVEEVRASLAAHHATAIARRTDG